MLEEVWDMQYIQKISVPAKDGAQIPAVTVGLDDDGKKAVMIICHGFGEHSGSYVELADEMRKAGYASIIPDQRGHGEPPEGVKNWHGLIPDYQCFVDDVISLTQYVLEKTPDAHIVLYGHSMGGNIVLNTLLQSSDSQATQAALYSCAVIESPWLGLHNPPNKIMLGLMKFLSRVLPNLRQEQKLNHGDLSGDTERSGGYSKDPLYHGFISMRMVAGILGGCDYAMSNAARLLVPTYIAYASDELVVCNKTIREFAEKAADVVTLKEYDSKHAIHNDKNRELFFNDVIAYMETVLSRGN